MLLCFHLDFCNVGIRVQFFCDTRLLFRMTMSNVVFFSNQFARKNGTGVTRYARNLVKAFAELNLPFQVVPVATWSDRKKEELNTFIEDTGLRILSTGRIATRFLWTTLGVPKIENLLDCKVDIVHSNDLGFAVATNKPYVVTVHDIGPLTQPDFFNKDATWIMQKNLEYAIKKADAFICVSQTTADSLVQYVQERYSINLLTRTYVAHEGISGRFFHPPDSLAPEYDMQFDFLQHPFILAVGKISPRKNLEVVIKALAKLKSSIPHHLVMVGGNGWDFQGVKRLIDSLGLAEKVHFVNYVSDTQLHVLYARASLFIYPSLLEGFGLPVLEAMASGCPVVTSNISSLPEVAGKAALLIDPHSIGEAASAMEMVCTDQNLAVDLKQKGLERAKYFSWEKCAKRTAEVYAGLSA